MFEYLIDDLKGETLLGDLENVGACYPDDDVIYVFGNPCRLSSARPVTITALTDEQIKQEIIEWVNSLDGNGLVITDDDLLTYALDHANFDSVRELFKRR